MPIVRLPGGPALHYQEWGRPDGAVVLLLHGLGSSSDSWRHVGNALGERFRIIAPDARGHGGSEWTHDYSFEAMHDDVAGLLHELGILAAIVVGHSMGALTAYEIAANRPDLIRLLVLDEMPPPDPADPPRPIPRHSNPDDKTDWRAVIAVRRWRNNPPSSWWDLAEKIPNKTLVIGATESYLPQERIKEISRRIPHATFTSVEGSHAFHEERPSTFLGVVEPFIAWFAK